MSLRQHGVAVAVRLTPRARADRILGIAAADGAAIVRASVTAPPEAGCANEALLRMLARVWRVPRRALSLVAGAGGRNKVVHIAGDPEPLFARLAALLAALPRV